MKYATLVVAGLILTVSGTAGAVTVDVSLEPAAGTVVQVGDTFDLELWFRSSTTGVIVHELNDLGLHWDETCVSFNGPASTADGAYAWSDAMSFFGGEPSIPMYWTARAANATYTDGDAELMLAPQFHWLYPGLGLPTTDQHQLTLTFTTLAMTDSTSIWLTTGVGVGHGVWAENPDAAHVMEVTGDLTGADITIVPEPLTMLAMFTGIAGLAGYIRRRKLA